jgi:hypothetical protein
VIAPRPNRRALRAAFSAAAIAGLAAGLALFTDHAGVAVGMALAAFLLVVTALVWALKQEDRR